MSDDRKTYFEAMEEAKRQAFGPEEYIGQESFISASEIETFAKLCGIESGARVLDLCCGAGGPALLVESLTGCSMLGVDHSGSAVELARSKARERGLEAQFLEAEVPPELAGDFEVVNLFETMLAFEDKHSLLSSIHALLVPAGRLAFTYEEGLPLSLEEQQLMPESATVHLTPKSEMLEILHQTGFALVHQEDLTESHAQVASKLADAYEQWRAEMSTVLSEEQVSSLVRSHRLWADWHSSGRSRKFAFVAQRD